MNWVLQIITSPTFVLASIRWIKAQKMTNKTLFIIDISNLLIFYVYSILNRQLLEWLVNETVTIWLFNNQPGHFLLLPYLLSK